MFGTVIYQSISRESYYQVYVVRTPRPLFLAHSLPIIMRSDSTVGEIRTVVAFQRVVRNSLDRAFS